MKFRLLTLVLSIAVLLGAGLCGCSGEPEPTIIPQQPATTTMAATVTTSPLSKPTAQQPSTGETTGTTTITTTTVTRPTIPSDSTEVGNDKGRAIAELAISLEGTPFKFGANGPDAFDNPSFVVYCYKQNGYTVPRKASLMATYGQEVAWDALQVGDILIFSNDIGGDASFCGIYIGDNRFISCNNPSDPTRIQKLNISYWRDRFITARRPAAE